MSAKEKFETHLENRRRLIASVAGEIFGPGSKFDNGTALLGAEPTPFKLEEEIVFEDWASYSKARPVSAGTNEEILKEERPSSRYGMGILFPKTESDIEDEQYVAEDALTNSTSAEDSSKEGKKALEALDAIETDRQKRLEGMAARFDAMTDSGEGILGGDSGGESDTDTAGADLRLTNLRRQRSMGISCVVDSNSTGDLVFRVTGGRYSRFSRVRVADSEKKIYWWVRHSVEAEVQVPFEDIHANVGKLSAISVDVPIGQGLPPLDIQLEIVVRARERIPGNRHPDSARLITVTIVNRSECYDKALVDQFSLFQARLVVTAPNSDEAFLPYPRSECVDEGEEQNSLNLLYRNENTFSTGHGCAGAWETALGGLHAVSVSAEILPSAETPSITPELEYRNTETGEIEPLRISLALLADRERFEESIERLRLMLSLYRKWIVEREIEGKTLDNEFRETAERHTKRCRETLTRMEKGVDRLADDPESKEAFAFRMTNRAMLVQALASNASLRRAQLDEATQREAYDIPYAAPDLRSDAAQERSWRPFQIAFLLMNISGLSDEASKDREIVDLIWFPTGGGKTEAYLGCAAYSMFMRRLKDPNDIGTQVLMRYTLRLLTAQQFQRASSLICAMEQIREEHQRELGKESFTIGIWVGGETTPNRRSGAVTAYNKARRNGEEDYKMVLLKCPWCGAEMGPKRVGKSGAYEIRGVRAAGQDVKLHCPDYSCDFSSKLPVAVVDEDIYESPPTYVIATVDKFASLAWREECRSLFGIDMEGKRCSSPPGLIIQDELHLITGPLGSMVGLYEALVDELATDRRNSDHNLKPKLIAATATTRASDQQIRDLYARRETGIFPAPGLDASDSFFAKYSLDEEGRRKPGRLYIGVLPVNYSSTLTASVRLFSSILASVLGFESEEERDPWWTLLIFYNSLRELGGALTLFGADIPERMKHVQRRWYPDLKHRYVREVLELTGRLANSEVPRALEALERQYLAAPKRGQYPVDACLASNIIEVGVDVDRLGIMAVAGQPKTTAQYIQATGRVGRRLPGAIITNYSASKARDRSHYEHFQTYHSRLYAQVEPASVTPFTIPVLKRALHAIMVATARQTLPKTELTDPKPFLGTDLEIAAKRSYEFLKQRINIIAEDDPATESRMLTDLQECYQRRVAEWDRFYAERWHEYFPKRDSGDQPLIRPYGSPCPSTWVDETWETPNSLRGVDSECRLFIPAPQRNEAE